MFSRTRARLAVVAASALVIVGAGAGVAAVSASADPGPLVLSPGTTVVKVVNLDRNASAANALSAYGAKVAGLANDANPVLQLVSAPDGGRLQFESATYNVPTPAPTPSFTELVQPDESLIDVTAPLPGFRNRDTLYLGVAIVPGVYRVRVFDDQNGDAQYDVGDEASTPVLTITALDVTNPNRSVNDWAPTVSYLQTAPKYGQRVKATIGYGGLTTTDVRGRDGSGKPILGWNAVGQHLQLQLNGGGFPTRGCTILDRCSWTDVTDFTSSVWYIVPRRTLRDVTLSDNLTYRVRLDPSELSGATWITPKTLRVISY